jgi:hypothetical protein
MTLPSHLPRHSGRYQVATRSVVRSMPDSETGGRRGSSRPCSTRPAKRTSLWCLYVDTLPRARTGPMTGLSFWATDLRRFYAGGPGGRRKEYLFNRMSID